jgi:hypothetical protein
MSSNALQSGFLRHQALPACCNMYSASLLLLLLLLLLLKLRLLKFHSTGCVYTLFESLLSAVSAFKLPLRLHHIFVGTHCSSTAAVSGEHATHSLHSISQ